MLLIGPFLIRTDWVYRPTDLSLFKGFWNFLTFKNDCDFPSEYTVQSTFSSPSWPSTSTASVKIYLSFLLTSILKKMVALIFPDQWKRSSGWRSSKYPQRKNHWSGPSKAEKNGHDEILKVQQKIKRKLRMFSSVIDYVNKR